MARQQRRQGLYPAVIMIGRVKIHLGYQKVNQHTQASLISRGMDLLETDILRAMSD